MGIKIGSGTPTQAQSTADGSLFVTGKLEVDGVLYADGGITGTVGGATSADIATATALANAATSSNTANAIVKRNASGDFTARNITANKIANLATPGSSGDAANRDYVDTAITGARANPRPCRVASIDAMSSIPSTLPIWDDVQIAAGDRVLIKNYYGIGSSHYSGNGIYIAANGTTWARSTDLIETGTTIRIQEGTVNAGTQWLLACDSDDQDIHVNPALLAGSGVTIGYSNVGATIGITTGSIPQSSVTNLTTDLAAKEATANKGQNNGYAGLDSTGNVTAPIAGTTAANVAAGAVLANAATNLNTASAIVKRDSSGDFVCHNITANTVTGLATPSASSDAVSKTYADTALATKEDTANKNVANGYAGLDSNGDITGVLIPRRDTATNINGIVLSAGELATTSDSYELRIGDGSTSGGRTVNGNTSSFIVCYAAGTAAANGTALVAAYASAKALTPGGSAISSTNRARLYIQPGTYSLTGAAASLVLDTAYVDVIGAGYNAVHIVTDNTYAVSQDCDNNILCGVRFIHTGNTTGAIRFNAGAGGSYAATNTGIIHEDLYFDCGNTAYACVTFNASITSLAGTYRRITANTSKKFYGGFDFSSGVSATFEDCVQGSTGTGAAGGFCGGSASLTTFNVFSGVMRRCRNSAGHVGLTVTGSLLYCELRNNGSNADCTRGGASGRFYYNKLQTSGTGYSIGSSGTVTISAAHNIFKANGIHTDNTNNIDTPYNVSDADWSG